MFEVKKIKQLQEWLETANNIVITAHKSADGDSIGSSLALYHYLKSIGHSPVICHPDKMPDFFHWLPDSDQIETFDGNKNLVKKTLADADIIFCLDFNHPSRVGEMENDLRSSQARKVMIDHHQEPDLSFFDISFSAPAISSTSELIYSFIEANNHLDKLNELIGTPMYCGIMTDTGSFRFPSTTADTHRIIAHLIDSGVKNHTIHENVFDTNSINQIQLTGFALSEKLVVLDEFKVAYITLTTEELQRYKATKGDTEGLVNKILSISGIRMAVFFKEDTDYVKISFRSKGTTYVNELAKTHFGGGGHIYAAGGKFQGSINDAIQKLVTKLPQYVIL